MAWINALTLRFRNSRVLISEKSFAQDGCQINLDSIPDHHVTLNADELKTRVEDVDNIIDGHPYCDLIVLFQSDDRTIAILIEAKSGRSHSNVRTRHAIDQLSWSLDHFANVSAICPVLPVDCTRFPVLTYTKPIDAVLRSDSVKEKYRQFRRQHRIRIRYIRAGRDIWQVIKAHHINHRNQRFKQCATPNPPPPPSTS